MLWEIINEYNFDENYGFSYFFNKKIGEKICYSLDKFGFFMKSLRLTPELISKCHYSRIPINYEKHRRFVINLISHLPPSQMRFFLYKFLYRKTGKEIAEIYETRDRDVWRISRKITMRIINRILEEKTALKIVNSIKRPKKRTHIVKI